MDDKDKDLVRKVVLDVERSDSSMDDKDQRTHLGSSWNNDCSDSSMDDKDPPARGIRPGQGRFRFLYGR